MLFFHPSKSLYSITVLNKIICAVCFFNYFHCLLFIQHSHHFHHHYCHTIIFHHQPNQTSLKPALFVQYRHHRQCTSTITGAEQTSQIIINTVTTEHAHPSQSSSVSFIATALLLNHSSIMITVIPLTVSL